MRAAVNERVPATKPAAKPWIAAIHAYVPGQSRAADGRELVKLSANENPLGSSPLALAARERAVVPSLYPDPDSIALREALGALHGIDPARIICGTGSGELLAVAASASVPARGEPGSVRLPTGTTLSTLNDTWWPTTRPDVLAVEVLLPVAPAAGWVMSSVATLAAPVVPIS